jgi:hypothetical protein
VLVCAPVALLLSVAALPLSSSPRRLCLCRRAPVSHLRRVGAAARLVLLPAPPPAPARSSRLAAGGGGAVVGGPGGAAAPLVVRPGWVRCALLACVCVVGPGVSLAPPLPLFASPASAACGLERRGSGGEGRWGEVQFWIWDWCGPRRRHLSPLPPFSTCFQRARRPSLRRGVRRPVQERRLARLRLDRRCAGRPREGGGEACLRRARQPLASPLCALSRPSAPRDHPSALRPDASFPLHPLFGAPRRCALPPL